ncbi:DNA gyrase subunit A [Candidatus Nomurabacteria bacterium]|nr:DNA gyrase subunit A [Candidatus Nomurabacteria bacterium]USN95081.1 MAG: DNA gyrase subunit A [Candidatus Nomurabacteria bacterium]
MPKKKVEKNDDNKKDEGGLVLASSVVPKSIVEEMQESYISYAMSVITSRALPDVRDGLKPVHRRILYAMNEMSLSPTSKPKKSAAVVGDVLGKYHPHGDTAVYDSMVNMAQDFSYRYPLVLGQGNFGSIDGDGAAAMRYTEARMTKIATLMLKDLDKDTVDWRPNYDASRKEPAVLPAAVPALLLNGTMGIAVGMATAIPPHNLSEVIDATVHLINNKDANVEDLCEFIQGPDFPVGGIIYGKKEIEQAYRTGRGGIVTRGVAEVVEVKTGQFQIVITSIPFQVKKSNLITSIADLVQQKKIEGIKDIRDLSTKDIKVVIDLKSGAHPQKVLNYLYKHTQLEQNFNFNMLALVKGTPELLSLKGLLENFIEHRKEVVRRRTEFDLRKAKDREHILLGLKKALDHIDKIISIIRGSKDASEAKVKLMKEFKFSDLQTDAILDMRLQKLAGLERKQVEEELKEKQKLIAELEALLASPKKILKTIEDELVEIKEKYGDERRTKLVKGGVKSISDEDLIPEKDSVLVFTQGGYVKRTDPSEYRSQKRGGVGVIDLETKEEDFVTMLVQASTHSDLLFFTNRGKAYQIKMYDLPEGKRATKGKSIMNFLSLDGEERVTSILPIEKGKKDAITELVMITKNGVGKKVSAESFKDVRRSGIISIKLAKDDELVAVRAVDKDKDVVLVSHEGMSIRFRSTDLREMGRAAGGVKGMSLKKGDEIVGAVVVEKNEKDAELLVMSKNGLGKKTKITEYKAQKRGGGGVKTAKVTEKTGPIIVGRVVRDEEEMIAMSKKGQVIRVKLESVPSLGRQTQGVSIMKLRAGDAIASVTTI